MSNLEPPRLDRHITFIEIILSALLISSLINGSRESDLRHSLRAIDDSIVDLQNEVSSQSEDIQGKLDDIEEKLEQIEANQP